MSGTEPEPDASIQLFVDGISVGSTPPNANVNTWIIVGLESVGAPS